MGREGACVWPVCLLASQESVQVSMDGRIAIAIATALNPLCRMLNPDCEALNGQGILSQSCCRGVVLPLGVTSVWIGSLDTHYRNVTAASSNGANNLDPCFSSC